MLRSPMPDHKNICQDLQTDFCEQLGFEFETSLNEVRLARRQANSIGTTRRTLPQHHASRTSIMASSPSSLEVDKPSNEIRILVDFAEGGQYTHLEEFTKQILTDFFGSSFAKLSASLDEQSLPIVKAIFPETPGILRVLLLCEGTRFTSGAGRHMLEIFNQWLIPGKPLVIPGLTGINFVFSARPEEKLFLCHLMISIESMEDMERAKEGISELASVIKKNIAAVSYVRQLLEKRKLNTSQQKALFTAYISSLQSPSTQDFDQSLYEHASEFFHQALAEKKIEQARHNIEQFLKNRRAFFDRDIFSEIHYFVWLYRSRFIGKKDRVVITRLISLQYLFRKHLRQKIAESPHIRHTTLKVFPLRKDHEGIDSLGLLVGINLLKDGEVFEERHVIRAVEQLIPAIRLVPDSFVQDGRNAQKMRLFYLEIGKCNGEFFTHDELSLLRRQLSHELKVCVETLIHPLFMPRNDEDLLRFSLQLCGQLNDPSAPPQMAIFFGNQTSESLSFTVLLARLLRTSVPSSFTKQLEQSGAFFEVEDIETRYPPSKSKDAQKEVISFTAKIPKAPFLRSDYTIDVIQARQEIVRQMHEAFGHVRDYNGGLLETQLRAEQLFLASLGALGNRETVFAKAFFHAITPPLMQVILETSLLKKLFSALLECQDDRNASLRSYSAKRYEFFLIKSSISIKKEALRVLKELGIPSTQITSTELEINEHRFLALIHQNEGHHHPEIIPSLESLIHCSHEEATAELASSRM